MATTFSTQQIDSTQRLAFWNEVICKTYLTVECQPQIDTPPQGHICVRRFGQLELSQVLSPAMTYRRSHAELREHSEEHYQLMLMTEGTGHVLQGDREATLRPGDIALYSAAHPSMVCFPTGSRTLLLKIPRTHLDTRVTNPNAATAVALRGDTVMGSMVGTLMRESFALEESNVPNDLRFSSGLLDIISAALDTQAGKTAAWNPRHNPIEQIKRYMQANLADTALDIVSIATKHNISIRTLNRLFAAEGTSAIRWLWLQRLAASHRALSEGNVRQVSEAALDCGFNDLSHFSKSFKKTYGIAPHQLLRAPR